MLIRLRYIAVIIISGCLAGAPVYAKEIAVSKGGAGKINVLEVGENKQFALPSIAAEFAKDGDVILIDVNGVYDNDVAIWKVNNLTIRGVNGRPHIRSNKIIKNGKAIWVLRGNNFTIENIEFSGAKVRDHNGAALRLEGANLTIKSCYFHHNENSLLTGKNINSEVKIDNSVFAYNGYGKGKTHNLYIGRIKKLTFIGNFSHHANVGHTLKSRARENIILYNRFMDGADGNASYLIDLPNGGYSIVMGNVIQQSPRAENRTMLAYGLEGLKNKKKELYVAYNTFVNNRSSGVFIKTAAGALGKIANNIFAGKGKILGGKALSVNNNFEGDDMDIFLDPKSFDFRLGKAVDAIVNRAVPFLTLEQQALVPEYQITASGLMKRMPAGKAFDLGAFEFTGR